MPGSCTVAQFFYFLFYWLVWETVDKWKHFGQLITMFSHRWAWHAQARSVGGEVSQCHGECHGECHSATNTRERGTVEALVFRIEV